MFQSNSNEIIVRKYFGFAFTVAASLLASVFIFVFTVQSESDLALQAQADITRADGENTRKIFNSVDTSLDSLSRFFQASARVSEEEFTEFLRPGEAQGSVPGVIDIFGWIPEEGESVQSYSLFKLNLPEARRAEYKEIIDRESGTWVKASKTYVFLEADRVFLIKTSYSRKHKGFVYAGYLLHHLMNRYWAKPGRGVNIIVNDSVLKSIFFGEALVHFDQISRVEQQASLGASTFIGVSAEVSVGLVQNPFSVGFRPRVSGVAILIFALSLMVSFLLSALAFFSIEKEELLRSRVSALHGDLVEKSNLIEAVLDAAPSGIVAANEAGEFTLWNGMATELMGVGDPDYPTDLWPEKFQLFHTDRETLCDPEELALMRAIKGEVVVGQELFVRRPSSQGGIYIKVEAQPILDKQSSEVKGGVVVFNDFSGEFEMRQSLVNLNKKLESQNRDLTVKDQELRRSNADLEQFAYLASHDLQTPLRHISSFVSLFEQKYSGMVDSEGERYIKYVVDGALRMKRLISELLNYSKLSTKPMSLESVDIGEVTQQVLRTLEFQLESIGASVKLSEDLPTIHGNRVFVARVLQNLLENSLKFRAPSDKVAIEVGQSEAEERWIIFVKDNGIGISEANKKHVYDLFHTLKSGNENTGVGIGLAVCKKIVERHNGAIWIDSKEGEGTKVSFSFPKSVEAEWVVD